MRGLNEPIGVAVGPDGLVYVAEVGYGHHVIDVYQITQGTAKLAHRIRFAPGLPPVAEYLAIGALNFLYATMDYTNIAVFRPGERGYVRTPHHLQNTGGAFQIGVDRFGDVYQPTTDHLYVHLGGCWAHVAATGISIALADGYLYETCAYLTRANKSVRGVWTFRADAGGVINALGFARSPVVTPGDIAIGP